MRAGVHGRTRLAALVGAVLALLVVPGGASGALALPRAPARIAGTTVLTATRSAVTVVRLPRAASLVVDGAGTSANVDVSARSGRLAGFVLTARSRPDPEPYTLMIMQVGSCARPGCRPAAPHRAHEYVAPSSGFRQRVLTPPAREVTLPAGDYTVRAVTDGAPVRATLRLAGLAGAARIDVTDRARVVLRTDSSPGAAAVDPVRNVGVAHTFVTDLGLMMDVILTEYEPHVRSQAGVCTYLDDKKPPTGRYHPTCPDAEAEASFDRGYPTLRDERVIYGADIAMRAGKWTRGFYLTGAGGKSSLTVVTLWVDLA